MRLSTLLVLVVALMVGCVGCGLRPRLVPVTPDKPAYVPIVRGAVPMDPYPMWRRWWAFAESCTGTVGDFDNIRWYWVPGWQFKTMVTRVETDSTGAIVKMWNEQTYAIGMHNRVTGISEIYIAEIAIMNRGTVMHEMLHALGFSRHRRSIFVRQCKVETEEEFAYQTDPIYD